MDPFRAASGIRHEERSTPWGGGAEEQEGLVTSGDDRGRKRIAWTGTFDAFGEADGSSSALLRAIGDEGLSVVFQPIIHVETGRIWAHEVLARCSVPGFEAPPNLFARAVEENAVGRLGRMVRNLAFSQAEGPLFVNIHPAELGARWLVRPDDPIGFHRNEVFLEITESAMFTHYDLCMSVLMEVRSRTGAHIVIDDFGSGYSNLIRIVELVPEVVKLDRLLVAGLDRDRRRRVLVKHMVQLCEELGASVVAEGIERHEEFLAVRDCGVHYAQGYYLGRPNAKESWSPKPVP